MADTTLTTGGGDLFGGGMGGTGGLLGGLLVGALLGNGGLFGNNNRRDGFAPETLRNPPEQNQANMDLMAGIGSLSKEVAVAQAASENSNAMQTNMLSNQIASVAAATVAQITGVKEAVTSNAMVLAQQLNGVEKSIMENRYELSRDITNDGDKTRALLVSQYEATLNRQLVAAQNEIAELRNDNRIADATRGIEVTTTNNINQMQQQQQAQAQYGQLYNALWALGQSIRDTNSAINVGSGTQTSTNTPTNTNIR